MSSEPNIILTDSAIQRVENHLTKHPGKHFRISVEAGGCSGFQYDFGFDEKFENDLTIHAGPLQVLVTPEAMQYINGSTVDFVDDFKGTGFTITNPNATGTCGCGVSFTV